MQTKTLILAALVAFAEARFGQEGLVQNAVQGLSDFGNPGDSGTLAGKTTGVLLGGANACDKVGDIPRYSAGMEMHGERQGGRRGAKERKIEKERQEERRKRNKKKKVADAPKQLSLADEIVATLGNDPEVLAAAAQLVAAEKNFNPNAQDVPTVCDDATLPATAELRGIVPLVDPDVDGAAIENANSASSLKQPFDATGLSVAGVMAANGFQNLLTEA